MAKEKVLVTSALPYANGPIHLGHLSGAYLPADIYVRYKRLNGDDVLYICGSDEHGVPITISAEKEGITPKEVIDRFHNINKEAFEKFGMSFDMYSRTSEEIHHDTAKEFFTSYHKQDLLKEKKTLQFFDEKAKMFLPDRYVEGTCPKCGFEEARSDECENCGSLYDASELVKPKSKISGEEPKLKETSHWYFPLNLYQDRLIKYIDEMDKKYGWRENVLQYCRGWFKDGLKERAVTRDLDWGVKVPLDGAESKVLYVWFEAVLGYISATKLYSKQQGNPDLWKEYWNGKDTKYVAFIGKDNVVFHTIIFPSMLMAWNDGNEEQFIYPQNVPANEFLNFEGKKFSKSRGWGIDVIDFLNLFPADALRYTLAINLPENKDTDFYWKELQARNNNELADILGNFINRTSIFAHKHFEGKVPARNKLEKIDEDILKVLEEYPEKVGKLLEKYKIKDAVFEIFNLARMANKYFNDSEPWKSVKTDKEKCATCVNISTHIIYTLAELTSIVIPFTSEKIFNMLDLKETTWNDCGKYVIKEGHQLNKAEILFTKIEDDAIEEQENKVGIVEETDEPIEEVELVSFEEFSKVQLKTAQITAAEKIKKSNKLLKLQVTLGKENRQIVAGIAKSYKPEELINRKVVIVANLKPAMLFGVESQGMLLAIENEDGKLNILEVNEEINLGLRVK